MCVPCACAVPVLVPEPVSVHRFSSFVWWLFVFAETKFTVLIGLIWNIIYGQTIWNRWRDEKANTFGPKYICKLSHELSLWSRHSRSHVPVVPCSVFMWFCHKQIRQRDKLNRCHFIQFYDLTRAQFQFIALKLNFAKTKSNTHTHKNSVSKQ